MQGCFLRSPLFKNFFVQENSEFLAPVNFACIRDVTARMHQLISSQIIDAPSWDLIRSAKLAARIYAPLGTSMTLGDFVRITRTFVEAFKLSEGKGEESDQHKREDNEINALRDCLKVIGASLDKRLAIFTRTGRGIKTSLYTGDSRTTVFDDHWAGKSGPIWDTWDEIAQYKLVYGLLPGLFVWILIVLLTLPYARTVVILVPVLMWMTLRWLEDAVSAFRAFTALLRLLWVGPTTLKAVRETRDDLHSCIMNLAVGTLGLPQNPERDFLESGGQQKGRVKTKWESGAKYFSVRRRRKRDWNETLRLYDKVDYPDERL
ncbi:hypothetical protein J3R82DRAFT_10618 [Butyriboletus roseoflavus]|nr:hypothetical protein J3R82DRAFT_10618 [Butyriboletus roseoflavus]